MWVLPKQILFSSTSFFLYDAGPTLAKAFYKAEVMIEQGQGLNSASAEVPMGGSPEYSCLSEFDLLLHADVMLYRTSRRTALITHPISQRRTISGNPSPITRF